MLEQGAGQRRLQFLKAEHQAVRRSTSRAAPLPATRPASRPRATILFLRGATGLSSRVGVEISSQGSVWRELSRDAGFAAGLPAR